MKILSAMATGMCALLLSGCQHTGVSGMVTRASVHSPADAVFFDAIAIDPLDTRFQQIEIARVYAIRKDADGRLAFNELCQRDTNGQSRIRALRENTAKLHEEDLEDVLDSTEIRLSLPYLELSRPYSKIRVINYEVEDAGLTINALPEDYILDNMRKLQPGETDSDICNPNVLERNKPYIIVTKLARGKTVMVTSNPGYKFNLRGLVPWLQVQSGGESEQISVKNRIFAIAGRIVE